MKVILSFILAWSGYGNGRDERSCHVQQWKLQDPSLALLTSILDLEQGNSNNSHIPELFAALQENLRVDELHKVHVLFESKKHKCDYLRKELSKVGESQDNKLKALVNEKLVCFHVKSAPTYGSFLRHSVNKMTDYIVILANTDVVFDKTLRRLDLRSLRGGDDVFVLSVRSPDRKGAYAGRFKRECKTESRCTLGRVDGWLLGGSSWDAYIYDPTRPKFRENVNHSAIDFHMFNTGGENEFGYQLHKAGFNFSNPCLHVHAQHWHCGGKMHDTKQEQQFVGSTHNFKNLMPCWDCPHIHYEGFVKSSALCRDGVKQNVEQYYKDRNENDSLRLFRNPANIELCCSTSDCAEAWDRIEEAVPLDPKGKTLDIWIPLPNRSTIIMCKTPQETDCVVSKDFATADAGRCGATLSVEGFFNQDPELSR